MVFIRMATTTIVSGGAGFRVDIDSLISEFNQWQHCIFDAQREKIEASKKLGTSLNPYNHPWCF